MNALTGAAPSFASMSISSAATRVPHTWLEAMCTSEYGYITGVDCARRVDAAPLARACAPILELREIVRAFCTAVQTRQTKAALPLQAMSAMHAHIAAMPLPLHAPVCKLRISEALILAGGETAVCEQLDERVRKLAQSLQPQISICLVNIADTRAMLAWATLFGERAKITGVSSTLDPFDAIAMLPATCAVAACTLAEAAAARGPFDFIIDMSQSDDASMSVEDCNMMAAHITPNGWLALAPASIRYF